MRINKSVSKLKLELTAIDLVSEKIQAFLEMLGAEKKNILRLRLSLEDILIKWTNAFGEGTPFMLITGSRMGRPYIVLALEGTECDPFELNDDFGEASARLLSNMGLCPTFSYQKGHNIVLVRLKKKRVNPLTGLLVALLAAVVFGLLGMVLPDGFRAGCSELVLTPVYETFLGILSTVAGPMIFLSVAWGIYGIGDAAVLGRIGKKMLLRFVGMTTLLAVVGLAVLFPFFHLSFAQSSIDLNGAKGVLELILNIFPKNIVSPFAECNTMQIIVIAAVVGCIMLILGRQTHLVAQLLEQINNIVQYLMELIGSLVPAFIFIVLLRLLWSDSVGGMLKAWKPALLILVSVVLLTFITILYVCAKKRVSPFLFIKKVLPTFLIAITTASSSASFGSNLACCEHRLGINSKVTNFGIPLGIVLYKPMTAVNFAACLLYFSEIYHVSVSPIWLVTAAVVIPIITIALPPVPRGSVTCYALLFMQMGIPAEGIGVALILDVFTDFLCTGFNTVMNQCNLVLQADRVRMLDREILRRPL